MSYEKKVSRTEPGLIGMIIDDSASMADNLPGTSDAKFMWDERYIGIILKECLTRSTELKGDIPLIKPRYYFNFVMYGSDVKIWGDGEMDIQAVIEKYTAAGNSLGLGGHLSGTNAEKAFKAAFEYLSQAVS
jgi:hypothetical protein